METNAPSSASRPAGYAAIALASAAGVIAASRMSRPALALAAGLALAWWKQQQAVPPASPSAAEPEKPSPEPPLAPAIAPEPVVTTEAAQKDASTFVSETKHLLDHATDTPAITEVEWVLPDEKPPLPTEFPVAPTRLDAPITDAWNDLRAALSPTLVTGSKPSEQPAFSAVPAHEMPLIQAPEMPEMHFSIPSSPLLDLEEYENTADDAGTDEPLHFIPQPTVDEPVGAIPDEICLPTITDEQTGAHFPAPGFLVADGSPDEPAPSLLARTFAPPVIVPKSDCATTADPSSPEFLETPEPLTAPLVPPHEAQAKKSFFDWLRS